MDEEVGLLQAIHFCSSWAQTKMDCLQQTNFDIRPHGLDGHGLANISGFSNALNMFKHKSQLSGPETFGCEKLKIICF